MKAFTQGMKSYSMGWQIWMKILVLVNFIIAGDRKVRA